METGKSDTLDAIIRAAKKMTQKKVETTDIDEKPVAEEPEIKPETDGDSTIMTPESDAPLPVMDGISQELSEELQADDTALNSAEVVPEESADSPVLTKASDNLMDLEHVSVHFLEFAIAFLTLAKCQYQSDTNVKVNSLSFFTLVALDNWAAEDYTMSELAEKLQITKQQFSRLINDLEEKGFVERIHDKTNRRRVYIRICDLGRAMMDDLKQNMLDTTLNSLRSYSVSELAELDFCICRLIKLMQKFNTDPE